MIFQLLTLVVVFEAAMSASTGSPDTLSNTEFSTDLFAHITKDSERSKTNLIFSPASIYTCLGLAYFGSEGSTADEIVNKLHFKSSNKESVAKQFENMLQVARGPESLIKMANKIYANKGFEIKQEFNEIARKSFESEAETLDFEKTTDSVNSINNWVAEHTNNKIQDLVDNSVVTKDSQMVLVNAIHFKGKWKQPFSDRDGEFFNGGVTPKKSDFMFDDGNYYYADLPDFAATTIKIPYKDSDLNLMLILPNEKTGLQSLEDNLKKSNLLDLSQKMKKEDVTVTMPKFKIESKLELTDVLIDMGMKSMFSNDAKFNFFKSGENSRVGKVVHKAFIDVNESGTEAGGATGLGIVPTSLNLNQKFFYVNKPFFFAILDNSNVYFTGHVINL